MATLTSAEWMSLTEPERLLARLPKRTTQRKRGLLATAACRVHLPLLADTRYADFLDIVEDFHDGRIRRADALAAIPDLEAAFQDTLADGSLAKPTIPPDTKSRRAGKLLGRANAARSAQLETARAIKSLPHFIYWTPGLRDVSLIVQTAIVAGKRLGRSRGRSGVESSMQIRKYLVQLIYDQFGNLGGATTFDPAWNQWERGTVARIAESIYLERRFDEMPILADALEDAGCTHTSILNHCRRHGPHARGCWVLDGLLKSEEKNATTRNGS